MSSAKKIFFYFEGSKKEKLFFKFGREMQNNENIKKRYYECNMNIMKRERGLRRMNKKGLVIIPLKFKCFESVKKIKKNLLKNVGSKSDVHDVVFCLGAHQKGKVWVVLL
jgi:hypothetical protein